LNKPVGIGVVGFGYWGPKLLRNLFNAETTRPLGVCELNPERREAALRSHPDLAVVSELDALLALDGLEAVAIATPVCTHFELALAALKRGKHVLVTKPFTQKSQDAVTLVRTARELGRVIFVDHTFLFTPAVRKLKELVGGGELGDLLYYDSIRINLGLFQSDVDVIWDLAPHDFSILDHVVPKRPLQVAAVAASHSPSGLADVAYVTLQYGDGLLAHFHLNWLAPMKVRQILIGGSRRMVQFNDIVPDEKVRIYDRGIESTTSPTLTPDDRDGRYQARISYRTGDMHAPWLDRTEALFAECRAFGSAVRGGELGGGEPEAGVRVVLMLEAAARSLTQAGRFVPIDWAVLDSLR
jgi:predicted dehydrogenase